MTPRTIRRAAERKAAKLAAKASRQSVAANITSPFTVAEEEDGYFNTTTANVADKSFAPAASGETIESSAKSPISEARLAANRANAEHSTGAKTSAGKLKVSLNALKTGLTSQVVVMPHEDAAAYKDYLDRRFKKFSPASDDEHLLVQAIVDNEWRLARIPSLEAGIYAIGLREFAAEFADEENLTTRAALIRAKTALHYRRDLSNQALQERRLRNHVEKDTGKLEELQKARQMRRRSQIDFCIKFKDREGPGFKPCDVGFDFSLAEFDAFLDSTATRFRLIGLRTDFDLFLATFRQEKTEAQAA